MKKRVKQGMALVLAVFIILGQNVFAEDMLQGNESSQQQNVQGTEEEQVDVEPDKEQTEDPVPSEVEETTIEQDKDMDTSSGELDKGEQAIGADQNTEQDNKSAGDLNETTVSKNTQLIMVQAYCGYKRDFIVNLEPSLNSEYDSFYLQPTSDEDFCTVATNYSSYSYDNQGNINFYYSFKLEGKNAGTCVYKLIGQKYSGDYTQTEIGDVTIKVDAEIPPDTILFPDENLQKYLVEDYTIDWNSKEKVYLDSNQDALVQKGELENWSSIYISSNIKDVTGLEYATGLTSLSVGDRDIFDFSILKNFKKMKYYTYSGKINKDEEMEFIKIVKELPALQSIRINNMSGEGKLELALGDSWKINKGEITEIRYKYNIYQYGNYPMITFESDIVEKSGNYLVGVKSGKTTITVTYGEVSKTIELQVDGADANIPLGEDIGKAEFGTSAVYSDNTIMVLRDNKQLWQTYPEKKKVMENTKKYVAGYVYEVDDYHTHVEHQFLNDNNELWDLSGKLAENVVDFDTHYSLQNNGNLVDIYNEQGETLKNVSDWGRIEVNQTSQAGYIATLVLKTDGTLWKRMDVGKEEKTNSFEQVASNVESIVKVNPNGRVAAIGYVNQNNEYVDNDGTVIEHYIDNNDIGIWTKNGFYIKPQGSDREYVKITDFKIASYFRWRGPNNESYFGLIDEENQIWKVSVNLLDGKYVYGEPEFVASNYAARYTVADIYGRIEEGFYVGSDNSVYDINGKKVGEDSILSERNSGLDSNHVLYKNGAFMLSDVIDYIVDAENHADMYAIRTDGSLWKITNVPIQIMNDYMTNGQELSAEDIETIINKISDAEKGETISVEMDLATIVPKEVLAVAKGNNVKVELIMDGYTWIINGLEITSDTLQDINMNVTTDISSIPQSEIDKVAGDNPTKSIDLSHDGEFGFKGTLSYFVGKDYAGKTGTLYYYGEDQKLSEVTSGIVDKEGDLPLPFTHASGYVIVLNISGKKGDVNGDDKVNLKDLMIILKHVSGKEMMDESQQVIADVNTDSAVNLKDLMMILKFVSGKILQL